MVDKLSSNISRVLATHEGKEVFRFLLELTGVVGGGGDYSANALHAAFMEGQRSIGVKLYRLILALEPKYLQIITNKIIEEQADNGRRSNDNDE